MPAAMTFASLQDDVRAYLERGFTEASDPLVYAQIPNLITLAQRRIARELKLLGYQNVVTAALTDGQPVLDKPDRWRETISINIGTGVGNNTRVTLFPRSLEYLNTYWPDRTQKAEPEFYADYDAQHWLMIPSPDADYPIEIIYWQLLRLLDDTTQTNWATENLPELLLYGTLLEATPFLRDDERIATWQGFYDRAAAALNNEDLAKIFDRASMIMPNGQKAVAEPSAA